MATLKTTVQPKEFVDLQDCDFYRIFSTVSVLQRPFNIADNVNLRQWQAAWRQFGELSRLVDIHRPKLIEKYGAEKFESFLVDLTRLVETPLRYGCTALQRLQDTLLEFRGINLSKNDDLRAILSNILLEAEIDAIDRAARIWNLLPRWARNAPELRSKSCPREDCFRIGETAIDVAMRQVPIDLLTGVRRAKSGIIIGEAYDEKGAKPLPFTAMGPWSGVMTALKPGPEFPGGIPKPFIEYGFFLAAIVFFLLSQWKAGHQANSFSPYVSRAIYRADGNTPTHTGCFSDETPTSTPPRGPKHLKIT
ncbi:hypothetical protein F4803DRAFT_568444 [Xylaria telfairii]|nr:hypothetical protein F4803DRAFT_568444 [Xylaria telfairii]